MDVPKAPRALASDRVRSERAAAIRLPHVQPINDLIDEIGRDVGVRNLAYNDPTFGGTEAEVLFVLKSPEGDAGSDRNRVSFQSFDNDDSGAEFLFRTCERFALPRVKCAGWNICPFPIEGKNPSRTELERARPYTMRMLELLPHLKVVLLLGNPAQKGWEDRFLHRRPDVEVVLGASPSPPGINQKRNRDNFEEAIRRVVRIVEGIEGRHG